jgi:phosphoribosylformylglycinamidine cyclo-ligase
LSSYYAEHFKESFDSNLEKDVVYIGSNRITDVEKSTGLSIGKLLLSPTRTFAPVMKELLENHFEKINGLVHDSGGGQTKCMKYVHGTVKVIKDNLFKPPPVFNIIKESSNSSNREMYEVFNMGCRLEVYCKAEHSDHMISAARKFNIDAQIIGRVEAAPKRELLIRLPDEEIVYA